MTMTFRTLKPSEIDVRVGSITEYGFTLLLYKDARCDMRILDETVGAMAWTREHQELKGVIYCGVTIEMMEENVCVSATKWDCGTESYSEKEKGEASDAFKRACVNWGIGRELYTAPHIFLTAQTVKDGRYWRLVHKKDGYGFKVADIAYNDAREINRLIITKDGKTVFQWAEDTYQAKGNELIGRTEKERLLVLLDHDGTDAKEILEHYGVEAVDDLKVWMYAEIVKHLGGKA